MPTHTDSVDECLVSLADSGKAWLGGLLCILNRIRCNLKPICPPPPPPPPRNLSPSILHTDCQRAVKSELSLRGALHFGIIPKWQPSAYHSIQDDTSATNKQKKKECTHANIRGVDQNSLSNKGCLTCSKHQPSSHHTFRHWIQTVQVQRRNTNRKVS